MEPNTLSGRSILVVEDEFLIALETQDILQQHGAVVVGPAYKVSEALSILQSQHVDLALLDVNLNGESSAAIADALADRGVPMILTTGYAGNIPFTFSGPILDKPYTPEELVGLLAAL